jgi:hypothetical protein
MGHLNAVGSKIAATAFLEAIAQASRKSTPPAAGLDCLPPRAARIVAGLVFV